MYDYSDMPRVGHGNVPPCFECPLCCGGWQNMMMCSPDYYPGLVGRYYGNRGTGADDLNGCMFAFPGEEVPFDA